MSGLIAVIVSAIVFIVTATVFSILLLQLSALLIQARFDDEVHTDHLRVDLVPSQCLLRLHELLEMILTGAPQVGRATSRLG